MATFPPQHWTRVWRPSLRLGGVRLPGLSLHWDPKHLQTCPHIFPCPITQFSLVSFLKQIFATTEKIFWSEWMEVAYDPENCFRVDQLEFQNYTAMNDRICVILTETEV